jgi:hypothetical protein
MVSHWNITRRCVPRLDGVEDVVVTCPKGHLAYKPFRVLRGASVTVPPDPCERCEKAAARKASPAKPKPKPKPSGEATVPPSERRIAARVAKAGDHLARLAEKAARQAEERKVRRALEHHRARERVKAAERRAKAARLARQLVKLWESGELPADLKAIVEAA